MSKFINALTVAILGIAMLMGAATAGTTGTCTVNACLMPSDYLELNVEGLDNSIELGVLPTSAPVADAEAADLKVGAGDDWTVTVTDDDNLGTMVNEDAITHLTNGLVINSIELDSDGEVIDSGAALACTTEDIELAYEQTLDALDTTVGAYTISITYTLANPAPA